MIISHIYRARHEKQSPTRRVGNPPILPRTEDQGLPTSSHMTDHPAQSLEKNHVPSSSELSICRINFNSSTAQVKNYTICMSDTTPMPAYDEGILL